MTRHAHFTKMLAAALMVIATVTAGLATAAPAPTAQADEVDDWLVWLNAERAKGGVAPLRLNAQESGLAQLRAQANANTGVLVHTPNLAGGVTENWSKLGENVGLGPSLRLIGDAFINSPSHYSNLMDPVFTDVGIGIVWVVTPGTNQRTQFVTHRFAAILPPLGNGSGTPDNGTDNGTPDNGTPDNGTPDNGANGGGNANPNGAPNNGGNSATTRGGNSPGAGGGSPSNNSPKPTTTVAPTVTGPAAAGRVSAVLDALHGL